MLSPVHIYIPICICVEFFFRLFYLWMVALIWYTLLVTVTVLHFSCQFASDCLLALPLCDCLYVCAFLCVYQAFTGSIGGTSIAKHIRTEFLQHEYKTSSEITTQTYDKPTMMHKQ